MKRNNYIGVMLMFALVVFFLIGGQSTYAAALDDGTYSIDFIIKKPDDDSVSIANDYWNKPATVIVNGGDITVQMTVNHSKWVTVFKVPSGNRFVDVKQVSSDADKDTRVVQFSVDSLEKDMLSQIHVTVPEINYDHDYTIRFVYDTDSLKLISQPQATDTSVSSSVATATPQPTAPTKSDNPKQDQGTTPKPSSSPKESQNASGNSSAGSEALKPSATPTPTAVIEAATQSSTTAQSATSTLQPVPSAAVNSTVDTVGKAAINEDENKDEAPSTSESASGEEAKVDEAIAAPAPVTEQKEVESENELEAEKETERSVELSTALDGVSTDDATSVVSASVGEDSSNNNWLVIVAIIVSLLIAGFIVMNIYRKRNVK